MLLLWQDSPDARLRHGRARWEPVISEYREVKSPTQLTRPAARLLATAPPKDEPALMSAATQLQTAGNMEGTQQSSGMKLGRPMTRERGNGRTALTVLQPNPSHGVLPLLGGSQMDMLMDLGGGSGQGGDVSGGDGGPDTPAVKPLALKVCLGPQRPRQVISFEDRIMVSEDNTRPSLTIFEHVDGSRVCNGLFPHYNLPNGKKTYMYYNGGTMLDEVHVEAVLPPPRPSTVPQALQQTMPLADVLNLIAKPPGSAPPFIPYKPVPKLVPLPIKHTLTVKRPDHLTAAAFGDLREDNLQLLIQVRAGRRACTPAWQWRVGGAWPCGVCGAWACGVCGAWPCGVGGAWSCGVCGAWPCGVCGAWPCGVCGAWPCGVGGAWQCGVCIMCQSVP